jgi:hypothetical protein
MTLTSAFQLVPEQSTAAMIVHHPEAKYYSIRGEGTPEAGGQKPAARDGQQAVGSGTGADSRFPIPDSRE